MLAAPAASQTAVDSTQAVTAPPPATTGRQQLPATMQLQRQGSENPFIEVMNTTRWGAMGGLLIGGAIALAADNGGEPVRWGIVVGTFAGLTYGIVQVATRAQPRALLEFDGVRTRLNPAPLAAIETGGVVRLHAFAMRF